MDTGGQGSGGGQRPEDQQPERRNERLERFVSVISHDLRNPLNVAQSSLELVEEESDNVDRIDRSLDRIEEIVEEAVAFARQGEPVENTGPVDLATVAENAWDGLDTGGATLETTVEGLRSADADRLETLFERLFRNAVDHGHGSTGSPPDDAATSDGVTVRVGELPGGFFVADDGPGVPPEDREQVFEPGYTTARQRAGLGLAIVRSIAEAHGWSVGIVESDAGGARVEITGVGRL